MNSENLTTIIRDRKKKTVISLLKNTLNDLKKESTGIGDFTYEINRGIERIALGDSIIRCYPSGQIDLDLSLSYIDNEFRRKSLEKIFDDEEE